MPNILAITVEQPDQILNAGAYAAGALIRLQWAATEAGTFADVSGTGSTPTIPVVTLVRSYTGYDPAGIVSTWYRTRFENSGATRLSDWSAAFQVAPEGSGLLCGLWDIKQRLGIPAADTTHDETILECIGQSTAAIQSYTGRRFARNPASGTTTFLFDVTRATRTLWVPKGIAEASLLEVATQTGGAFSTVTAGDWFLDPPATERDHGWPATRIVLSDIPTGGVTYFYPGKRVVRVTMAEGWAAIPPDISAIAQRASEGAYLAKGSGASGVTLVGATGGMTVLRNIAPADMDTLTWYRHIPV
jgi:hypothetical protein